MTTQNVLLSQRSAPRRGALFSFALRAWDVHRQRTALKRLTSNQLNDIGLTQRDVDQETGKPIWDVPQTWRR